MLSIQKSKTLLVYSVTHAIVDAACIMLILSGIAAKENLAFYIILYNILAFGLQAPFGWLTDKIQKPEFTTILGCGILISGLILYRDALLATILMGIGNALFHVGGGSIALNLNEKKAALPGVFVSTGGLGLFAGGLIAKFYGFQAPLFIALLAVSSVLMMFLKATSINYQKEKLQNFNKILIIILLILISIGIRSVLGLSINYQWKSNIWLLLAFTIAIVLGKGLGGFLSDRFGWIKISVGGLFLSAFLLYFGYNYAVAGIIGVFIFNFTMPVTLVAVSNLLPGRPGFSFGLTTIALLAGALPTFANNNNLLSENYTVLWLTLLSTGILYVGLKLYFFFFSGSTKSSE